MVGGFPPVLFVVYTDGLFASLIENGFGCHIGQHFPGGVFLINLVSICEDYSQEFDIFTFNGAKS